MNKNQQTHITSLYYRLYVTYFEANPDILRATNRNAFYRLSIYHQEQLITEMVQGINPVILADKIFLNSAVLNFQQQVAYPLLKVRLKSHYSMNETTIGQADLNLQRINDNYFQFTQRFNSLQFIIFNSEKGDLRLIFNIFVEKNKADLDLYIKRFKENQREVMRAKRYVANKKRIEIQDKTADIENSSNTLDNKVQIREINPTKVLGEIRQRQRSRSRSSNRKKMVEIVSQSNSNSNYLQINSAAKLNLKKLDRIPSRPKIMLSEIEQKQFQAYSSHLQSFHNSKLLSYDQGSLSIISDGSEQSQMIKNNMHQTYSQRSVARFKQKAVKCFNIMLLVLVLSLLYFLLTPSARFQKRAAKKREIEISDIAEELVDI